MSLTSQLDNPKSILNAIIKLHLNMEPIAKATAYMNAKLANCSRTMPPVKYPYDYLLAGMATTYAFRWFINPQARWWVNSICASGARKLGIYDAMKAIVSQSETDLYIRACTAVLMGALDTVGRGGKHPMFETLLNRRALPSGNYLMGTAIPMLGQTVDYRHVVIDVMELARTFDKVWYLPNVENEKKYYANPTFNLSEEVGGADAQGILGNSLLEIKTSIKAQPVSERDILKQVMYTILDDVNEYKLKDILFFYPRHHKLFRVDITNLVIPEVKRSMSHDISLMSHDGMRRLLDEWRGNDELDIHEFDYFGDEDDDDDFLMLGD